MGVEEGGYSHFDYFEGRAYSEITISPQIR